MRPTDSLADIEKGVKNKWVWDWYESPDAIIYPIIYGK